MYDMPPKTGEMTATQLLELLDRYGVPYGEWSGAGAKSVEDLLSEITAGEARLIETEQGLMRIANGLGLDVLALIDGVRYRLIEARQEFPDGTVRHRHISTSLGEKIKEGEGIEEVINRALQEELGIEFAGVAGYSVGETEECRRESGSYPGLATSIILNHAAVELSADQFKPEGYVEEQPGRKRTYFEWEILR